MNEGRDDLIVRGIHVIELHIESFASKIDETGGPKMRRLIRRAPIWAAVDALSLARSLVRSLFYYFFNDKSTFGPISTRFKGTNKSYCDV